MKRLIAPRAHGAQSPRYVLVLFVPGLAGADRRRAAHHPLLAGLSCGSIIGARRWIAGSSASRPASLDCAISGTPLSPLRRDVVGNLIDVARDAARGRRRSMLKCCA